MENVGGYRLVRTLGEGERARVFLGHAGADDPPNPDRVAAVKVYRPQTPMAGIDVEVEALARAASRHLVELRDVAMGPDGRPTLVLGRLSSQSLARLLTDRGTLTAGEAVTALAPLAGAVRELHRVGVAHGAIRLSSVLIDVEGAPVLARFGAASLVGAFPLGDDETSLTPAQVEKEPRVAKDLNDLAAMSAALLARVDYRESARLPGIVSWLGEFDAGPWLGDGRSHDFAGELEERLYDLAPALPLRLDLPPGDTSRVPQRAVPPHSILVDRRGSSALIDGPEPHHSAPPRRWPALRLPAEFDNLLARNLDAAPGAHLRERLKVALGRVRKPVWIAGGAGVLAAVVGFSALPVGHDDDGTPPSGAPSVSATTGAPVVQPAAMSGDDPLEAAAALIAARAICFEQLSVLCLDGVDQAGSAAMESDSHLVRQRQAGGTDDSEGWLSTATAALAERLGDSALVTLAAAGESARPPASLLLVKEDAGWRIRDLTVE